MERWHVHLTTCAQAYISLWSLAEGCCQPHFHTLPCVYLHVCCTSCVQVCLHAFSCHWCQVESLNVASALALCWPVFSSTCDLFTTNPDCLLVIDLVSSWPSSAYLPIANLSLHLAFLSAASIPNLPTHYRPELEPWLHTFVVSVPCLLTSH